MISFPLSIAKHPFVLVLPLLDASEDFAIDGGNDGGVVIAFDGFAGEQQRFEQIVRLHTRPNARHIRPDLSTGTTNAMTLQAIEFLTAISEFTPLSTTFLGNSIKQFHGGCFPLGRSELACLGESIDQRLMHLTGGAGDADGDLGDMGGG